MYVTEIKTSFLILVIKIINILKHYKNNVNMDNSYILMSYDEKELIMLFLSLTRERGIIHVF
ncbi:hypothetical protein D1953_17265 [Peribacillus asahii]|uniref:Uncharacterized protein n=1 Tax=Peribacillus asahii TaxID=228899 RepID=A0A398AYY0_9BACI|nr:hypothetical protein D1953_17265 [Peribacillus asahii]